MISSGVVLSARSIISRTAGSWLETAARSSSLSAWTWSSSASSISVLSNRLPRLSGAIRGWSGRTIAAPSTASSLGVASTGKVLTLRQASTASPAAPCRLERRDEAAAGRLDDDVRGQKACPKRLRATHGLHIPGEGGRVVDAHHDPGEPGLLEHRGPEPDPSLQRRLALEAELPADSRRRQLGERAGRNAEPALDPLVALAGRLQEADGALQHRLRVRLEHALDPQVVEGARIALRVRGRVDDPERRRGGVLRGSRRVRIEGVALVQQRGDELFEPARPT